MSRVPFDSPVSVGALGGEAFFGQLRADAQRRFQLAPIGVGAEPRPAPTVAT